MSINIPTVMQSDYDALVAERDTYKAMADSLRAQNAALVVALNLIANSVDSVDQVAFIKGLARAALNQK